MTQQNQQSLMQIVQNVSTAELLDHVQIVDRFKELYKVIHGIKDQRVADAFYTAEKFHFLKLIANSPKLQQCTKLSLYGIFMDVAVSGLSFDPSMKHLYIVPYNINVGTKQAPQWEMRAALQISGIGELLLRQLQGQVKHVDNPVVVFEGDEFCYGCRDGRTIVEHIASIPRRSDRIIACYLGITRNDGSRDYKVMAMEDVVQLRKFSKDPDSVAWTTGIKGMVEAKTIKHAFKNYPKIRMGEFTRLESETIDEEGEVITRAPIVDYGLGPVQNGQQQPQQQQFQQQPAQLAESQSVPFNNQMQQQPQMQPLQANSFQNDQQAAELNF